MKFKTEKLVPSKAEGLKLKTKAENSKILRIIDVNVNRAVEGLRVVEDIARFVLDDKKYTVQLKEFRSKIRRAIKNLLKDRRSSTDVGRKSYTKKESKRSSIQDIFAANAKRAQEALRVLEEFSKLIDPRLGKTFKDIRFKIYDLEKKVYFDLVRRLKLDFDLYVVTDPMNDHLKVVRGVIAGGGKVVQLRDKKASKSKLLKLAKQIRKLTAKADVIFIMNDYFDIANKVGADGIHLGQEDLKTMSLKQVRRKLGDDKVIGVSTHSFTEAVKAEQQGADYVSLGPIFSTPSKPHMKPLGLNLLRKVAKRVKIPIVAIGGINQSNILRVKKAGVQRAAVIRSVVASKKIKKAVRQLRKVFQQS
ncbi:MAG: thiamine phosphate synthase [Candidatus Margulisbacteria bacterium]|nr:thiamine phosphate synthase [Candidatus Margulisiibacteriota bacterium]